jgi:hypothetical protein
MITSKLKTSRTNSVVPSELRLGLLVLAALVLTSAMPAFGTDGVAQCTAAPSGLVGWWPGDGNAKDITPADHDGTLKDDKKDPSPDTDTAFTTGEVGQAFLFDGEDDYVDVPYKSDLNPANAITVDAWINLSSTGNTFYPSIIQMGNVGNYAESYALYVDTSLKVAFLVNINGTALGRATATSSTAISRGTWYFVAGTYDKATGSVNVYVNGKLAGSTTHTDVGSISLTGRTLNATTNDLLLGKADRTSTPSPYPDSYFSGKIDEVELFNRALSGGTTSASGGELGAIYSAGSAGKCKCQEKPAEADGDVEDDDGHKSHVSMTAKRECDDNGQTDFKDDSGTEMKGENKAVKMSGNNAMVSGPGTLQDGTPVYYTAVLVGNQPLIGANLFSITWTTASGSFFHRSGVMLDGYIIVPPQ